MMDNSLFLPSAIFSLSIKAQILFIIFKNILAYNVDIAKQKKAILENLFFYKKKESGHDGVHFFILKHNQTYVRYKFLSKSFQKHVTPSPRKENICCKMAMSLQSSIKFFKKERTNEQSNFNSK